MRRRTKESGDAEPDAPPPKEESNDMARMHGSNRRRRKQPPMVEPFLTVRLISIAVGLFVAGIVFVLGLSYANTVRAPAKVKVFHSPSDIPANILSALDAVLVLGGGVPKSIEEPPAYVQRRCKDAAAVVEMKKDLPQKLTRRKKGKKNKKNKKAVVEAASSTPVLCLSAGTAHLAQLMSADGLPIWESTSSAAYLQKLGVENLYVETTSFDTIGNAFYARTSHTDLAGWRQLLIVTNEFHMARTQAIFEWIFALDGQGYDLYFLSSPDVGLSAEAIQARSAKEASSLEQVTEYTTLYRSMYDVWAFLNTKHALYSADALVKRGKTKTAPETTELVKKSYGGSR